jgi:hypothetical protein
MLSELVSALAQGLSADLFWSLAKPLHQGADRLTGAIEPLYASPIVWAPFGVSTRRSPQDALECI